MNYVSIRKKNVKYVLSTSVREYRDQYFEIFFEEDHQNILVSESINLTIKNN